MSEDVSVPMPTVSIVPLTPYERRVLGVLIEKQKTSKTADAYPMTLNSLTLGCNQKSNRDPVYELDDDDVEETLNTLSRNGYTLKVTGGRADRYRHLLYDLWRVSKVEMAILAELLLRGPQSEGDLRGRASRMDDIADLDTLRELLKGLVSRGFVIYLTPPGRGAMVTHGFHSADELEAAKAAGGVVAVTQEPATPRGNAVSALETRLTEALAEIASLKERVARLEAK